MGQVHSWAKRGQAFEQQEKAGWIDGGGEYESLSTQEAITSTSGRRGRVDIIAHQDDGTEVVIETKATDWDTMAAHRVRPNVLRHIRQLMRYVNHFVDKGIGVHPALIYRQSPSGPKRRQQIEEICVEACVEVVWRDSEATGSS